MDTKNLKNIFKNIRISDTYDKYPDAVLSFDFQKNIVIWNKQAQNLFGYTKKEIVGKNVNYIFNEDTEKIYKGLNENRSVAISARTKSNTEIIAEVTCADLEGQSEIIIAIRDITRSRKAIEKIVAEYDNVLNESQNKSSFVSSLSGELRTPMHSIIGFSQALLDGLGGELSEKQKKYVSIISKNANNLLALLNSLLDLSKIEAGKMEYSFKIFDVISLINSIVEIVNPILAEKKVELSVDLSDIIKKSIYSDENHLRQILLNILTNAVKFIDLGSISIKVLHPDLEFIRYQGIEVLPEYTDKSFLMFSIADTGIGIAENDINYIFDEYRQLDRTNSKKYGGTGLSLAITKKITEGLGGKIWVESELGEGSTFSFIIPIDRPKFQEKE